MLLTMCSKGDTIISKRTIMTLEPFGGVLLNLGKCRLINVSKDIGLPNKQILYRSLLVGHSSRNCTNCRCSRRTATSRLSLVFSSRSSLSPKPAYFFFHT